MPTYQVNDTGRVLLLFGVLDEEEETLARLAGPGNNGVSNLGLLATKIGAQVSRGDRLLAKPEVLLGEAECTTATVSIV